MLKILNYKTIFFIILTTILLSCTSTANPNKVPDEALIEIDVYDSYKYLYIKKSSYGYYEFKALLVVGKFSFILENGTYDFKICYFSDTTGYEYKQELLNQKIEEGKYYRFTNYDFN